MWSSLWYLHCRQKTHSGLHVGTWALTALAFQELVITSSLTITWTLHLHTDMPGYRSTVQWHSPSTLSVLWARWRLLVCTIGHAGTVVVVSDVLAKGMEGPSSRRFWQSLTIFPGPSRSFGQAAQLSSSVTFLSQSQPRASIWIPTFGHYHISPPDTNLVPYSTTLLPVLIGEEPPVPEVTILKTLNKIPKFQNKSSPIFWNSSIPQYTVPVNIPQNMEAPITWNV